MNAELPYFSGEDLEKLRISSRQARGAIVAAFRDYAEEEPLASQGKH